MSYGQKEVLKVILLGNGGVGKSSLMRRYVDNVFEERTLHTIGVEFLNKTVEYNQKTFTLQIWDTGGQERFKSLRTPFYRGCDICILVFDLSDDSSFADMNYWLDEFHKYADLESDDKFPVLLLGNKADLQSRGSANQDIYDWCQLNGGVPFIETSAKTNLNVEKAFLLMLQKVVEQERDSKVVGGQFGNTIKINRTPEEERKKCCSKN